MNRSRAARALLCIACALVLFAQQAGLAHAVWHAAQQIPQQQSRFDGEERPYAPELTRLCAFDAAFGQVLGCAPPLEHAAPSFAAPAAHAHVEARAHAAGDVLTPRSRGPPALL